MPNVRRMHSNCLVAATLFCSVFAFGQKPEYDFYPDFRNDFVPKLHAVNASATNDEVLERYAAKLKSEGVADSEIARRTGLIRAERGVMIKANYKKGLDFSQLARCAVEHAIGAPLASSKSKLHSRKPTLPSRKKQRANQACQCYYRLPRKSAKRQNAKAIRQPRTATTV